MPQQTHFTSDAVISRRSPLTAPPSLPARRKSSPRLRGWSGRKVHTGQGVRRINSVSSTGTENPLIRGGHSALLVGYPVNVSHRAAVPASTAKVICIDCRLLPKRERDRMFPCTSFRCGPCACFGQNIPTPNSRCGRGMRSLAVPIGAHPQTFVPIMGVPALSATTALFSI